ncbi:MAG: hypothetical protein R3A52_19730 [Polyangiales bacterium]
MELRPSPLGHLRGHRLPPHQRQRARWGRGAPLGAPRVYLFTGERDNVVRRRAAEAPCAASAWGRVQLRVMPDMGYQLPTTTSRSAARCAS